MEYGEWVRVCWLQIDKLPSVSNGRVPLEQIYLKLNILYVIKPFLVQKGET